MCTNDAVRKHEMHSRTREKFRKHKLKAVVECFFPYFANLLGSAELNCERVADTISTLFFIRIYFIRLSRLKFAIS